MNPLSNQTSTKLEAAPGTLEDAERELHDSGPSGAHHGTPDDKPPAGPAETQAEHTEIPSTPILKESPAGQTADHPPPREQTTEERFDQAFRAKNIGVALHAATDSNISQHFNQHFDQSINHQNHFNIYIDLKKDEPESASATQSPPHQADLEWFVRYREQSALCCFRIALAVLHGLPYTLVFDEARHLLSWIEPEQKPENTIQTDNEGFFKKGPVKSQQLEQAQAILDVEYAEKGSPWGPFPQEIVRFKPNAPSPGSILKEAWQTYPTLKTPLTA